MQSEMELLHENSTWELVRFPPGKRALLCKADSRCELGALGSLLLSVLHVPYVHLLPVPNLRFSYSTTSVLLHSTRAWIRRLPYPRVRTLRTSPKTLKLSNSASLGIDHVCSSIRRVVLSWYLTTHRGCIWRFM